MVVLRKHARLWTGHLDISKAVIKSRNSESLIYYLCISVGLLYKCEPPQKVWFFSRFIFLETSVDFYGRGHTSCRVSNFIDTFFISKKIQNNLLSNKKSRHVPLTSADFPPNTVTYWLTEQKSNSYSDLYLFKFPQQINTSRPFLLKNWCKALREVFFISLLKYFDWEAEDRVGNRWGLRATTTKKLLAK